MRRRPRAGFHAAWLRISDVPPVRYTGKRRSAGANRVSDLAARPPELGVRSLDQKFDSDDVPIYDHDPFTRVE